MKRLFLLIFTSIGLCAMAQTESDPFGSSYNYDSTSFSDSSFSESTITSEGSAEPELPRYKKYERFKAPIDTITNLVTYMGVVPFKPMENDVYDGGTIDSLYWRAKKFLMEKYIKDYRAKSTKDMVFPKDLLIEDIKPDGENGRIVIKPTIQLYIRNNSFSNTPAGTLTFRLEIRVKEDKYKYKFSHFVHNTVEKGSEKPLKTYIEFYANNTRGYKGTDQYLLAVDRMVKEIVRELSKVMKDPIVLDPDDF
jgi:hypothetical protein